MNAKLFQDQLSRYYEMAKVETLGFWRAEISTVLRRRATAVSNRECRQKANETGTSSSRAFLQIAISLDDEFLERVTLASDTDIISNGPFFVLACGVQEYLRFISDHKQ